jgi:hypothetical protein
LGSRVRIPSPAPDLSRYFKLIPGGTTTAKPLRDLLFYRCFTAVLTSAFAMLKDSDDRCAASLLFGQYLFTEMPQVISEARPGRNWVNFYLRDVAS